MLSFWMHSGHLLSAISVCWNDSVQILSTIMHSTKGVLKWWHLWLGTSFVLVWVLSLGWMANQGDVSYGRLATTPFVEPQWYHVLAPAVLVVLTRIGIPVSTSFLVLSVFTPTVVLEKMLVKSVVGITVAGGLAFGLWLCLAWLVSRIPNIKQRLTPRVDFWARIMQVLSTALLWAMWLKHDMANIAVFLPRQLPLWMLYYVMAVMIGCLAYVFATNGGRIADIVKTKTNTRFVISATIVDLVYALILWYFKMLNNTPMSTTWVFVGLLLGREVAIQAVLKTRQARKLLPMIIADLSKLIFGALISVGLVFWIRGQVSTLTNLTAGISSTAWVLLSFLALLLLGVMAWATYEHRRDKAQKSEVAPVTAQSMP